MIADWEPLLSDDRVGKIADLLFIAFPELPRDTEVFTFVVPAQALVRNNEELFIPEQAVFALKSANPRAGWDAVYRGKQIMSTSGMWRSTWDNETKMRSHYVSTREDPAFAPFAIAARSHVTKIRGYRDLI